MRDRENERRGEGEGPGTQKDTGEKYQYLCFRFFFTSPSLIGSNEGI